MKKKISILFIIVITSLCIYSGLNIRRKSNINYEKITDDFGEEVGYIFKTSNGNVVVVDGGNETNAEKLEAKLLENDVSVNVWFITNASIKNFGALEKIIENGNVKIDYIYKSFNDLEWYEKNQPDEYEKIKEFIDKLESYKEKIQIAEMSLEYEFSIDDLNFKITKIKNDMSIEKNDQKMDVCVDNIFKEVNV